MPDFGTDFAFVIGPGGVVDIDPTLRMVAGRENLVMALVRRFTTPSLFYDEAYGEDIRAGLGDAVRPGQLARYQARLAAQALRDERIKRASATATFNDATRALRVRLALEDDEGPFELVLNVSLAAGVVIESVTP